jgi:hypothetical protein
MAVHLIHRLSGFRAAVFIVAAAVACSSAPPPKPAPPPLPDASEKLVLQLTKWLKLDDAQQAKTREFARALIDRNEKIMDHWKTTKKPRPEELAVSRGQFQAEFLSILTAEQRKTYAEASSRVMTKGAVGHR